MTTYMINGKYYFYKINLVGVIFQHDSENISDQFLDDRMSRSAGDRGAELVHCGMLPGPVKRLLH